MGNKSAFAKKKLIVRTQRSRQRQISCLILQFPSPVRYELRTPNTMLHHQLEPQTQPLEYSNLDFFLNNRQTFKTKIKHNYVI